MDAYDDCLFPSLPVVSRPAATYFIYSNANPTARIIEQVRDHLNDRHDENFSYTIRPRRILDMRDRVITYHTRLLRDVEGEPGISREVLSVSYHRMLDRGKVALFDAEHLSKQSLEDILREYLRTDPS